MATSGVTESGGVLQMPKPGSSPEEFAEYYRRIGELNQMGDAGQQRTPLPGETLQQYQQRLSDTQQTNYALNPTEAADAYKIWQLQNETEGKSRGILGEQDALQKTRLNDLAALLAQQQDTAFNRNIPGIAETAQGQGFLETSGFGNALARNYTDLQEDTSFQLARQGLSDRDLQIQGLGNIGAQSNELGVAGLERTFSTGDLTRSENLSRELGRMGIVNPRQETDSEKFANYAGGIGAVVGAGK